MIKPAAIYLSLLLASYAGAAPSGLFARQAAAPAAAAAPSAPAAAALPAPVDPAAAAGPVVANPPAAALSPNPAAAAAPTANPAAAAAPTANPAAAAAPTANPAAAAAPSPNPAATAALSPNPAAAAAPTANPAAAAAPTANPAAAAAPSPNPAAAAAPTANPAAAAAPAANPAAAALPAPILPGAANGPAAAAPAAAAPAAAAPAAAAPAAAAPAAADPAAAAPAAADPAAAAPAAAAPSPNPAAAAAPSPNPAAAAAPSPNPAAAAAPSPNPAAAAAPSPNPAAAAAPSPNPAAAAAPSPNPAAAAAPAPAAAAAPAPAAAAAPAAANGGQPANVAVPPSQATQAPAVGEIGPVGQPPLDPAVIVNDPANQQQIPASAQLLFAGPGLTMGGPGGIFWQTNDGDQNVVFSANIDQFGNLTLGGAWATGGVGSHVLPNNVPNAFESQGSVKVVDDKLTVVNAGSNTVSLYQIDFVNPAFIRPIGGVFDSMGDFPIGTTIGQVNHNTCVLNAGARNTIACFVVNLRAGLQPIPNTFVNLNLTLDTPPLSGSGTPNEIFFNADQSKLFVTIKASQDAPGQLLGWDVDQDTFALSAVPVATTTPTGTSLTQLKDATSIFTNAIGTGVAAFQVGDNLLQLAPPVAQPIVPIPGSIHNAWSEDSGETGNYYMGDSMADQFTEIAVDPNTLVTTIVGQTQLPAGGFCQDMEICNLEGHDTLFILCAGTLTMETFSLNGPGQIVKQQSFDFAAAAQQAGLSLDGNFIGGLNCFQQG